MAEIRLSFPVLIFSSLLAGCAHMDPRRVDVALPVSMPAPKTTSYTQSLADLGLMTEIYGTPELKIQCTPVGDNTGASMSTGGEIPRDITEILKSVLNAFGGRIIFIPYDPAFMQNQAATGYANFQNKTIPDVILSGGITEFDRGLETRAKNTDLSGGAEFRGLPEAFPSKAVEFRAGAAAKSGLSRITLDFNLLDLETMTGLPKMNITNSMEVHKALREKELGISLFGQSFGAKGSAKKVQGRHAAVRLLVELSAIQLVGKHLRLPYWRVLGQETQPDPMVLDQIAEYFRCLTPQEALANAQEWLALYGYDMKTHGQWDERTKRALIQVDDTFDPTRENLTVETFTRVYLNIPLTADAKRRRDALNWN